MTHTETVAESAPIFLLPAGDAEAVTTRLYGANPGETVLYFLGELAVARDADTSPFGPQVASEASAIADTVLRYSREGWIELTQRRISHCPPCFAYLAKRRVAR